MGRYFANGIAAKIVVYSKNGEKDINDLDKIKKHLSRYFNMDSYDVDISDEQSFSFRINADFFKNNIYDCCRELEKVTRFYDSGLFDVSDSLVEEYQEMGISKIISKKPKLFSEKNFPLNVEFRDDDLYYVGATINDYNGGKFGYGLDMEEYWLYWNCDILGYKGKYRINLYIILLGLDYNKFYSEDETYLLYVVNNIKNSYYKNPLSKNNIFYIEG